MFLESIKTDDGKLINFDWHQQRMHETLQFHYSDNNINAILIRMENTIQQMVSMALYQKGIFKLRVVYNNTDIALSFEPYVTKPIKKVKIVHDNAIDYSYKYENRTMIDCLLKQKHNCDDILICKNGFITDTSFTNVVFKKNNDYFTPATYLLNGTKRRKLIADGIIKEADVTMLNVYDFDCFYLINAMLELDESKALNIKNIIK